MTPEQDDYLADDGEDRSASRSLLSAGWLRALLVLGALAVVIVITTPYLLQWLETGSTERPAMTDSQITRPMPTPSTRIESAPAPAPDPAASSIPAPAAATAPTETVKEPPITKERSAATEASPAKDASAAKEMPAAKEPARVGAATPRTRPPSKVATTPTPVAKDPQASTQTAKAPTVAARAAAPPPAAPTKSVDGAAMNGAGSYWVQVGLFENAGNAERLAQEIRADRFSVQVAQVSRGGDRPAAAQHELFVTGSSVDAVTTALKGSGTAQAVTGGVRIRPALDLKDAVALSRRLSSEGLEVRIRRVGSAAGAGGATVHLVRVGGYATPSEAQTGKKALAARGIAGFVTQGAPR